MLSLIKSFRTTGVLGLNRRNSHYIMRYNPRSFYPLVDDKLRTKQLALDAGMAVPELYGAISSQHDIRYLSKIVEGREQFVIKPARGSGGDGILVIAGYRNGRYRTCTGQFVAPWELNHHVSSTVSGRYSLGGQTDSAMIEYCVQFDPLFEAVSYNGVPDIRIIVFRGYPVMAMVRLPTRQSGGKANLHQGAVGVGIDLATGTTLRGVLGNNIIDEHPDNGNPISGLKIPHWRTILSLAARCFEVSGLGYMGVDVVLDRDLGPLILELNARPGLNIQIANGQGLLPRLRRIEADVSGQTDSDRRLDYSCQHFAAA